MSIGSNEIFMKKRRKKSIFLFLSLSGLRGGGQSLGACPLKGQVFLLCMFFFVFKLILGFGCNKCWPFYGDGGIYRKKWINNIFPGQINRQK